MSVATLLFAGAMFTAGSPALALTRGEALAGIGAYVLGSFTVTSANVYPQAACYTATLREKLGVGTYYGAPYSYGGSKPYSVIPVELSQGKGAGNSRGLYNANPSCVQQHITGIDCSGLVCQLWQVSRTNTTGLTGAAYSVAVNDVGTVREADVFDWPQNHVVIFNSWDSFLASFHLTEASGGAGRCIQRGNQDLVAFMGQGYAPYASVKLKDDPASQIARFEVEVGASQPVVRWTTLIEDRTESFAILRADSPGGPFQQVSPDVAAKGGATYGADYEFVDASPTGGPAFYRLVETESNGRQIQHGTRSLSEAAASRLRNQP